MKKLLFRLFFTTGVVFSSCGGMYESSSSEENQVQPSAISEIPALIPLPVQSNWGNSSYQVPRANIICHTEEGEEASEWLAQLILAAGREVQIENNSNCGNWQIEQDSQFKESLGEEGYRLVITAEGVRIQSATQAGSFYAIQTLRQMFPVQVEREQVQDELILLREGEIQDQPRYSWRGTMVDVARSFFDLEYLKKHVDRMALYKMNRLHLHLTDDQGWRIEIKSKPKLTEIGSEGSVIRGRSGFLSQEEYKELQDYALERNIIIIPEIDMPGHIYSALAAYPELNCEEYANLTPQRATPPAMFEDYNVGWSKLCLENSEIYDFVSEVIGEMAAITEGPWIHIGGDEIEDPRYKEFVVKADSIVQTYGKTTIGWEEVTQAEVSSDLISQVWRDAVEPVVDDLKVIHSLCSQFYFDHANVPGQENTNNWCKASGVSIEDVYSYQNNDPNVLGVEAPVWSEFVLTDEMMDNRFWPRTVAAAEVAWTPETKRDLQDFKRRLGEHGERLRALDINFFRTPGIEWGPEKKAPGVFSGFGRSNKY